MFITWWFLLLFSSCCYIEMPPLPRFTIKYIHFEFVNVCLCVCVGMLGMHKHPNETDNILLLHVLIRIGVLLWLFLSVTIWRAFCSFQSNIVVVMWLDGGFSILSLHFTSFIFITCIAFAHKNGTSTDAHQNGIFERNYKSLTFFLRICIDSWYCTRLFKNYSTVCVGVCVCKCVCWLC